MSSKLARGGSEWRFAFSLALITLMSPCATDMYLASMPDITRHMNVSYASVQLTLTVFLMAQGLGQIFFGPLIDRFGRRRPLLAGLVVFMLASVWAAGADSITTLIVSRFVQGLSGALLLVVGFSSVRDVTDGADAARLFAILMTIEGLAPIFAPIIGGYVDAWFGWRVVLLLSALMGAAALANSFFFLPETLAADQRLPLRPKVIAGTYKRIITDRAFLIPTLALSSVFFYLFAYIGGGAYLYQDIYQLSPDRFGLIFGATGIAVMLGAVVNGRLVKSVAVSSVAVGGVVFIIIGTGVALISSLTVGMYGLAAGFVISMFGLGVVEPALMALVMSSQKSALGFTAALMGSLHLMLSSLSTPVTGVLLPLSLTYWFVFLLMAAGISLGLTIWAGRLTAEELRSKPKQVQPEPVQPEPAFSDFQPQNES